MTWSIYQHYAYIYHQGADPKYDSFPRKYEQSNLSGSCDKKDINVRRGEVTQTTDGHIGELPRPSLAKSERAEKLS